MNRAFNTRRASTGESGFTLIELMIVIAIIGILAAVAVPQFLRARDKAQYSRCVESLKSVSLAQELYITDNGRYTASWDRLATYMIAGCTAIDGSDCPGEVKSRVNNNCEAPTITLHSIANYRIEASSKDRYLCEICVTSNGIYPENYDPKKCLSAKCP